MPDGSAPRAAAARALLQVLDGGRALDEALVQPLQPLAGSRDRALARRLCHGVLRDWPALDWLIGQLVHKPLRGNKRVLHFLLAASLHELRDGREPAPAVVHASVAAARRLGGAGLSGLINAVLRNFGRSQTDLLARLPDSPVMRLGFPGWLVDALRRDHAEVHEDILQASNQPPPLWLRVNTRRGTLADYRAALVETGLEAQPVPGFADGLKLSRRVAVGDLPGFADGLVSIQDGAAQLTVEHLELVDGQRVLDACAAPGGKAAHILERAEVDLNCLDVDAQRLERVAETLARLGLKAGLQAVDASRPEDWWDGQPYDRILIDAPCSATGVIRRHPDIRWLRRPEDIARLVALQKNLLDALWPLLKPGGILVYATCSLLRVENDEQARSFLERHANAEEHEIAGLPGRSARPGRQLLPGDHGCDGFYHFAARRLS